MIETVLLASLLFVTAVKPLSSDWAFFRGDAAGRGVAMSPASPQKLQLLWKRSLSMGWFEASPIIADGTVFIGNSEDSLDAFNLRDGTPQWRYPLALGTTTPAVWYRGVVFVVDGEQTLHAINATTGQRQWSVPITGSVDQSPNIFGDTLLLASQSGELLALDTATGERRGVWKGRDQLRCSPTWIHSKIAHTNGVVFLAGCDGHLHVVGVMEKAFAFKEVASIDLDAPTGSTVAIHEHIAVVGTEGNELLGVDWQRGVVVWRFSSRQPFRAPAAIGNTLVVAGGHDHTLYGFDLATGARRWEYATKGRIEGGAVLVGDAVLFGGSDSRLVLLDAATGELRDNIELDGKMVASIAISNDIAVIGTQNGILYAFALSPNALLLMGTAEKPALQTPLLNQ